MENIIQRVRQSLSESVDEKTLATGQRFFKEKIKLYGVKTTVVHSIAKKYFEDIKHEPKQTIFGLCEELWKSGITEETYIACDWSYRINKRYESDDLETFEHWVDRYVNNWASCDSLCNHSVGDFLMMYPQYIDRMKFWAVSENRWMRRAAAVSLIIPARKGMFLDEIFDIADILLHDTDDLVQKGYGWMLKAASQAHLHEVFEYVVSKKAVMPRTALRYAIEKMPPDMRSAAMEK